MNCATLQYDNRRHGGEPLRHAFATEAIAAGVDIKTVAGIMGDDPRMLLEHYQHVADKQKRAAGESLPE